MHIHEKFPSHHNGSKTWSPFFQCQRGEATRMALIEMGHSQPPTPAVIDSTTKNGFFNDNIRQRRSRAINMHFYWVRDRFRQGKFMVYWMVGEHNLSEYFTKSPPHHPPSITAEHISSPCSGLHKVCMLHVTYWPTRVCWIPPRPGKQTTDGHSLPPPWEVNRQRTDGDKQAK